jgi:inner membrane protein
MHSLVFWHWWALAAVLLAIETFIPGAVFLWMGISAAVVGALIYFMPALGWEVQLLIFAPLSVITFLLWRSYHRHHPTVSEQPLLNQRARHYVGRIFTLEQPIVNGEGKIRVDDSLWKIRGADCPSGTRVEVTDVDGVVLKIRPKG